MTIYKPNNPERKQEKKSIVAADVVVDDKQPLTEKATGNDVVLLMRRRPITNTEVLRRRRRIRCAMIMLLMLLVVAMALVTALLFNSRTLGRPYMGDFTMNYHESLPGEAQGLEGAHGSFKESYEIDGNGQFYEKLDVPPVLNFRRSTVLHDFDQNLTAIVDRDHKRCFILPLNRTAVQPPKNFIDLLDKFKSGHYLPDAEILRETYMVVLPPLRSVEQLGFYIWSDCQFFSTYRLIKTPKQKPSVASKKKRSAECSMIGDGFCLGATLTDRMTCVSFADCTE